MGGIFSSNSGQQLPQQQVGLQAPQDTLLSALSGIQQPTQSLPSPEQFQLDQVRQENAIREQQALAAQAAAQQPSPASAFLEGFRPAPTNEADNSALGIIRGIFEAPQLLTGRQSAPRDTNSGFLNALRGVGELVNTLRGKGDEVNAFRSAQAKARKTAEDDFEARQLRAEKALGESNKASVQGEFRKRTLVPFQNILKQLSADEAAIAIAEYDRDPDKGVAQANVFLNRRTADERRQNTDSVASLKLTSKRIEKTITPEDRFQRVSALVSQKGLPPSLSEFNILYGKDLGGDKKSRTAIYNQLKRQGPLQGPLTPEFQAQDYNRKVGSSDAALYLADQAKRGNLSDLQNSIWKDAQDKIASSDPKIQKDGQDILILLRQDLSGR